MPRLVLVNLSILLVILAPSSVALIMVLSSSVNCLLLSYSNSINCTLPEITPRILLKSCATPAAIVPNDFNFSDCARASSACLRLIKRPIRLPIADIISSKSLSGFLISWLKKQITPSTSLPLIIGKPKAPCNPSLSAMDALTNFVSWTTSSIHNGLALSQTRPGSPTCAGKVMCFVADLNSLILRDNICQISEFRKTPSC